MLFCYGAARHSTFAQLQALCQADAPHNMVTALGDASPVATLVNISNTFDKWAITKIHRKPTLQLECIQTQEPCTWRHYHNFEWYAGGTVGQSQLLRSHFCSCKTSKAWCFYWDFRYGRIYAWMSREKSLNFAPRFLRCCIFYMILHLSRRDMPRLIKKSKRNQETKHCILNRKSMKYQIYVYIFFYL